MSDFSSLGLAKPLLRALDACGYTTPTPVQARAIPPLLEGRDVLGCAQTGTGKTAAFSLPVLQHVNEGPRGGIRALVLTPTRELAAQIGDSFHTYGKHLKLRHHVIFGGVNQKPQVRALRDGIDILVACPGRLLDLHGQGHVDLSNVDFFVLDEADRMLDMGFVHDVRRVLKLLPRQRQNLLFSATLPKSIVQLADSFLQEPVTIRVTPKQTTVRRIDQTLMFVTKPDKKRLLGRLLSNPEVTQAIVFTRTKHGANRLVRQLDKQGLEAMAIHGNKSQNARTKALNRFREGGLRILVATDVASRGIDIDGVSHVFNYDLPNVPESYVHRIGRTGRAGRDGRAIAFCDDSEHKCLRDIERLIGEPIPVVTDHPWHAPDVMPSRRQRPAPSAKPARSKPKASAAPARSKPKATAAPRRRRRPRRDRA